jgi:hypothetical protein
MEAARGRSRRCSDGHADFDMWRLGSESKPCVSVYFLRPLWLLPHPTLCPGRNRTGVQSPKSRHAGWVTFWPARFLFCSELIQVSRCTVRTVQAQKRIRKTRCEHFKSACLVFMLPRCRASLRLSCSKSSANIYKTETRHWAGFRCRVERVAYALRRRIRLRPARPRTSSASVPGSGTTLPGTEHTVCVASRPHAIIEVSSAVPDSMENPSEKTPSSSGS